MSFAAPTAHLVATTLATTAGRRRIIGVALGADDDFRALAQLVGAVDHDAVAGLHAGKHLDAIAVGDAELHRAHRDRAVVLHEIDESAGHAALNARARHRHHVLVGVEQEAD